MRCPQTMYRIKDPKQSLDFYTRIIGFRQVIGQVVVQEYYLQKLAAVDAPSGLKDWHLF